MRRGTCVASFVLLPLIVCPMCQGQKDRPEVSARSMKASVGRPGRVVLKNLPQIKPQAAARREMSGPQTGLSDEQYQTLKEQARRDSKQNIPAEPTPPPEKPPLQTRKPTGTPLASLTVLPPNSNQEASCLFRPADGALAASANFIVQVNNDCISVLNGAGVTQPGFPKSSNSFFGAGGGDNVGDPRAVFDSMSNRFIVIAANFTTNALFLAASQTADPRLGWNVYAFPMGAFPAAGASKCGDYPMLGETLQEEGDAMGAIYVSFNQFACPAPGQFGAFVGQNVFIIPKTPVYGGQGFAFWIFFDLTVNGTAVDTVHPANVMNRLDRPRVGFLMNTFNINFNNHCVTGCDTVAVWAIVDGVPPSGRTPSMSGFVAGTPSTYFFPSNATQPGCANPACLLDTGDVRIGGQITYSAGSLYAAVNTNSVAGSPAIIAWEVHPTLNDAGTIIASQVRNDVCFGCGGFIGMGGAYYGTLQPDTEGTFTMVYNFSSPAEFPGTAYLSRRVTQAANTFRDSGFFLMQGQAFYQQLVGVRNRWGDYTAAAPSYLIPNSCWFAGMFSQANGNWATAIGRNGFTNPDEP